MHSFPRAAVIKVPQTWWLKPTEIYSPIDLFSPGGQESEIKVSARPRLEPKATRKTLSLPPPLSVAVASPWLVAASLQSLRPSSHGPHRDTSDWI